MNEPPEKTALLSALNLLSPVGITLPNHLRKISGCLCSPSVEPTKIALFADRLLDVRVGGFAVELRFHARQELSLLLGNAKPFEGALYILGHFIPRALGSGALGEVVADVFEDDIVEIIAGPMRRHGFFHESPEASLRNARIQSGSPLTSDM